MSAVQSERSDPVPQPQVADEEVVGSLSAHESELSETIHPSVGADVRVVNRGGVAEVGVTPVANGHVNPVVEGRVTPTAEGPSEERRQAERPSETAGGRGAGMNGSGPDADGDAGQNNQRGGGSRGDNHNQRWMSDQEGWRHGSP